VPGLDIWALAKKMVIHASKKRLHGLVHVIPEDFENHRLQVVPHEPPRRHVHVLNWPASKAAQKNVAQKLAAAATESKTLELLSEPIGPTG